MGYKKPILIELYAQAQLKMPVAQAKVLEMVGRLNPVLPEVEFTSINTVDVNTEHAKVIRTTVPRIRCWSSDRTKLVQLSPDMVIVNHVGSYLGWGHFVELFRQVYGVMQDVVQPLAIESLSLHTIDRLESDRASFVMSRYFACGGRFIPQYYANVREACDISLGHGVLAVDGFNRQVGIAVRLDGRAVAAQITAAFQDVLKPDSEIFAVLEKLHDESNATFEALITDETRKLMS